MSFYQPSLSLYDVLNALSTQGQTGYSRDQLYQLHKRQAEAEAQRRAERLAARRNPFYARFDSGPTGYYGGLAGGPYYYRPDYYDYSEDEADVEEPGFAGDEPEEDEEDKAQAPYLRIPSYYHSRAPRGNNESPESQGQVGSIQDLLSALLGAPPAEEIPDQAKSVKEPASEQENESKEPLVTEKTSKDEAPQVLPDLEKGSQTGNKKKSLPHVKPMSPLPDPLQVSKPETRLDLPFSPEVNVYDCPSAYTAVVALPGATSKAFKVDYHPSSHELIIKGSIDDKLNISEKYLRVTELKYGAFQRTVKFPVLPRIKDEEIKATYNNGLLQIKVPKIIDGTEKPAPKKRIVIEEVPDEELEFEENPNPAQAL